jgi:hypothetical protein
MKREARCTQLIVKDAIDGRKEPVEHMFWRDEDGYVHERFSTDEPGAWSQIIGPERISHAKRKRASVGKRRQK